MQHIAQVASGHRKILDIFGANHATPDGTGVRDYIHVQHSAPGHVAAVQKLVEGCGSFTANLGTGHRHSVPEVVRAFERASGQNVPCLIAARRPGNVAAYYADASKAERLPGWRAQHHLKDMCFDTWPGSRNIASRQKERPMATWLPTNHST